MISILCYVAATRSRSISSSADAFRFIAVCFVAEPYPDYLVGVVDPVPDMPWPYKGIDFHRLQLRRKLTDTENAGVYREPDDARHALPVLTTGALFGPSARGSVVTEGMVSTG